MKTLLALIGIIYLLKLGILDIDWPLLWETVKTAVLAGLETLAHNGLIQPAP